jgi:hypothetical protein
MLTENDVIGAVCNHLGVHGHKILSRCDTAQRGIDIIAARSDGLGRLLVEAKGGNLRCLQKCSLCKSFDSAQVRDHVANAFYIGACLHSDNHHQSDAVALAFPDTPLHRKYLNRHCHSPDTLSQPAFLHLLG